MPDRQIIVLVVTIHLIALAALLLSGCSTGVIDPGQIRPPDGSLMAPPRKIPDLHQGDDLRRRYAELRQQYGREAGKLRGLQRYVRTIGGDS